MCIRDRPYCDPRTIYLSGSKNDPGKGVGNTSGTKATFSGQIPLKNLDPIAGNAPIVNIKKLDARYLDLNSLLVDVDWR